MPVKLKCNRLIEAALALPAYEQVLKASHLFNLLDARSVISVTERQQYILRIRTLARLVAAAYLEKREELGFPLLKKNLKMKTETLLIEIGSEELPPKALKNLGESFASLVSEQLKQENFSFADAQAYFTPRRLAVMVTELSSTQPEQMVERKGPALKAAYDSNGNATKAALGFATSCGGKH